MNTPKTLVRAEVTEYGFNYGAAEVTRMHRDHARGTCLIGIKTPRAELQVYVTRTGLVRVFDKQVEWKPSNGKTQ